MAELARGHLAEGGQGEEGAGDGGGQEEGHARNRPVRGRLRRGEVLIWASNLVHGGSMILDPDRTRMSQVTHYFGNGQMYFTPMLSRKAVTGRCYRFPYDVRTGPLRDPLRSLRELPIGRASCRERG